MIGKEKILIMVLMIFMLTSCSTEMDNTLIFGLGIKNNEVVNQIEEIPAGEGIFAKYTSGVEITSASINLSIIEKDTNNIYSGSSILIAEDKQNIIIPVTIDRAGEYIFKIIIDDITVYEKEVTVR